MDKKTKIRRDDLLNQYWRLEDAKDLPKSLIGYWHGLYEIETNWQCKNIISCIIEKLQNKNG